MCYSNNVSQFQWLHYKQYKEHLFQALFPHLSMPLIISAKVISKIVSDSFILEQHKLFSFSPNQTQLYSKYLHLSLYWSSLHTSFNHVCPMSKATVLCIYKNTINKFQDFSKAKEVKKNPRHLHPADTVVTWMITKLQYKLSSGPRWKLRIKSLNNTWERQDFLDQKKHFELLHSLILSNVDSIITLDTFAICFWFQLSWFSVKKEDKVGKNNNNVGVSTKMQQK